MPKYAASFALVREIVDVADDGQQDAGAESTDPLDGG
jgi:hypothetical protein